MEDSEIMNRDKGLNFVGNIDQIRGWREGQNFPVGHEHWAQFGYNISRDKFGVVKITVLLF